MPRRYADPYLHPYLEHLLPMNQFMTYSAILMGCAQFLLLFNFAYSLFYGEKVGRNPWKAQRIGMDGTFASGTRKLRCASDLLPRTLRVFIAACRRRLLVTKPSICRRPIRGNPSKNPNTHNFVAPDFTLKIE